MAKPAWTFLLLLLVGMASARAQEPFEGLTLISPMSTYNAHLLDLDGTVVKTWHGGHRPASIPYLLDDGSILRPCRDPENHFGNMIGGTGGRIQRIDADDNVVWDYLFSTYEYLQHHDIEPMPNGNVLIIAWERRTNEEAIAMGRQNIPGEMWTTLIVEVQPAGATGGNIVWEWHLWDHLVQDVDLRKPNYGVISEHPELLDINLGTLEDSPDWMHVNAIDYNQELDQIIFSSRNSNEFYIIDHSTTTEEAAGHTGGNSGKGGDILYRWGNPQNYGRGSSADQYFYVIHGVNWIDEGLPGEGNILAFNNGDRPGVPDWSTVDEVVPPVDGSGRYSIQDGQPFGPDAPVWTYGEPVLFYGGQTQCGAFRLPNGNTLITLTSAGYLFEVTQAGTMVWDFDHPSNIARAQRYAQQDPTAVPSEDTVASANLQLRPAAPNPFGGATSMRYELAGPAAVTLAVYDIGGSLVRTLVRGTRQGAGRHHAVWNGTDEAGGAAPSGVYFVKLESGSVTSTQKVHLLR